MIQLVISPKQLRLTALILFSTSTLLSIACAERASEPTVDARYDEASGELRRITINELSDGKPNVKSEMQGAKFVRIEIDSNEDGKTDRWEYYGHDERLTRVGISRANDGIEDAWVFQGTDGSVARVEISTRRDGKVNRTEFYEKGLLTKAEEDANGDGRLDKWEQYEGGALISASFDTANSGHPTTTVDYRTR